MEGRTDAGWHALGSPAVEEANARVGGVRWIPVNDSAEGAAKLAEAYPGSYPAIVKAGTVTGMLKDTPLLSNDIYLVGAKALGDEAGYVELVEASDGSGVGAAIIAAVFFAINPNLFRGGSPGSFEYVRKAEGLLAGGNYSAAIRYYEKAHEASPESDAIRDDLVYAYSGYAIVLSDAGKYDMALEYLSKSYDLVRNTYTRQNLSLMHAKRALFEARKPDWVNAQADKRIRQDFGKSFWTWLRLRLRVGKGDLM